MSSRHLRPPLPEGPYLILGLGRSGAAAATALRARGEEVIGWDAGAPEAAGRLSEQGVEVHLNASGDAFAATSQARTLIKSPGVPQDVPTIQTARLRRVPILGELELAWRLLPNEFITVTGTNGKTTTTEWIAHMHRVADVPVVAAGNVGTALSSFIGDVPRTTTIVCEASSFQLEDSSAFAPEAAVLLNLAPDHLDRHLTYDDYVAAKLKIFANQSAEDLAVVPDGMSVPTRARVVVYGSGAERELADRIELPGEHNRINGMAAAAVCLARGLDPAAVAQGLETFTGVPHRLELIAEKAGVSYVNDSKATNVASTLTALSAYDQGVHLIAGGRGKRQDFSPLAPLVEQRCKAVYLIGEDAPQIAEAITGTTVPTVQSGDLEHAVAQARSSAKHGDVVLLSPACASYDQYRDFEARGERFRRLVEAL